MITIKKSTITSLLFLKYALLFTTPQGDDADILFEPLEYTLYLKDNSAVSASTNFVQNCKALTTIINQHDHQWALELTDSPVTLTTFSQLNTLVSQPTTEWDETLKQIDDTYGIKGIENLYSAAVSLQLESYLLKFIADFMTRYSSVKG